MGKLNLCSVDWPWAEDFSLPVCIRKIPPAARDLPWILQSWKLWPEFDTPPFYAKQGAPAQTVWSWYIIGMHPASGLAKSLRAVIASNLARPIQKSACELFGRFCQCQLRAALSGSKRVLPKENEAELPATCYNQIQESLWPLYVNLIKACL